MNGAWALAFYQFLKTSLLLINWKAADKTGVRVNGKKMAYRGNIVPATRRERERVMYSKLKRKLLRGILKKNTQMCINKTPRL